MNVEFVIEGVIVDQNSSRLFLRTTEGNPDDGIAIDLDTAKRLASHVGEHVSLELERDGAITSG